MQRTCREAHHTITNPAMRKAIATIIFFAAWLALLWMLLAVDADAQHRTTSHTRVAVANIAVTGVLTLGRAALEGEIDSWRDALETLAYGSAAGAGFYAAKRLAGRGRTWSGMGLAYVSASVAENVATGRKPFSYLRLGLGPLEVRTSTRQPLQTATLEVNAARLITSSYYIAKGYSPRLVAGRLAFSVDHIPAAGIGANRTAIGASVYGVMLLSGRARETTIPHETIHAIQTLQLGAVTPYYRLSRFVDLPGRIDVQMDWMWQIRAWAGHRIAYEHRPFETEAYSLTN